jgi:septum formation topological specificity factor MinE
VLTQRSSSENEAAKIARLRDEQLDRIDKNVEILMSKLNIESVHQQRAAAETADPYSKISTTA